MSALSAAVTDVRTVLNDTASPHRYADADLERYLVDGISTMFRMRPDLRIGVTWTRESTDIPDVFDDFLPLLTEYAAAKAELRDDQFATDGRVVALFQKVRAGLLTPGV
jgi:hypothetical protein